MPKPDASAVVYRYPQPGGGWVYVNDLALVPPGQRDAVERLELSAPDGVRVEPARPARAPEAGPGLSKRLEQRVKRLPGEAKARVAAAREEVSGVLPFVRDLDAPSLAVGFAVGLAVVLLPRLLRRSGRLLVKVALVLGIAALLVGAYLGWVQRAAGLGDGAVATPADVVREAEEAAGKMKDRLQKNERALERLEETSR